LHFIGSGNLRTFFARISAAAMYAFPVVAIAYFSTTGQAIMI